MVIVCLVWSIMCRLLSWHYFYLLICIIIIWKKNIIYLIEGCKALQLWLLSRHGTRHPTVDVIDKISNLTYYKNQITENSTLCQEDIDAIKTWSFNLTRLDGSKLNSQGADDLSSLGSRLKHLYEQIFNETYNSDTFKVQNLNQWLYTIHTICYFFYVLFKQNYVLQLLSSPKSRCVDSAFYFLKSAFNMNSTIIPLMSDGDTVLNVYYFNLN